jgi:hypothetical protein
MSLKFGSFEIPGTHGPLVLPSPELKVRRFQIYRLLGEGEIVGKRGGRTLQIQVLLHDSWEQPEELDEWKLLLEEQIGVNDTLKKEISYTLDGRQTTAEQRLDFCTFEGYEPDPETPGPLPDVAGMLDSDNGQPIYGWFQIIWLRFRQLRAER